MHIGLLQAGHMPEDMLPVTGDYPSLYGRLLEAEGLRLTAWPVVDGVFPDSIRDAEGWLVSGSRHGAYENHDWIQPLEAFIREAYEAGIPVVGICFGHQIVAQALGGAVEKAAAGWGVGPHDYDWDGETVTLNAWHQDQVVEKPAAAEVVASSAFCPYGALRYGDRAFTVQAHPEFDRRAIELLIESRGRGLVPDERLERALANLDRPTDERRIARRIADFFKAGRVHERMA